MIRTFFLISLVLLSCSSLSAQNANDALRYSAFEYGGTARYIGTGSALGPLGADLSVLNTNPAGIGLFRRSEFTITPAVFIQNSDATLLNSETAQPFSEGRTNVNFQNVGAVITSRPLSPKWKNVNLAFALNNTGNFNRNLEYSGRSQGSITQSWQAIANSVVGLRDFQTGIAEQAGALYDFDANGVFDIDYELTPEEPIRRSETISSQGSVSELSIALGGNYNERVIIGLSLGIPIINFREERRYSEADDGTGLGGSVPFFEQLNYTETLNASGAGINAKLGVILRLSQALRVSGAVHTPTGYSIEEEFRGELLYSYFQDDPIESSTEFIEGQGFNEGLFDYRLSTPWRFFTGASFVFGKRGFLSAEVEIVDYSNNSFNYDGLSDQENEANADIQNRLENVVNVRVGGEVVVEDFRFRAGIGILPSVFVANENTQNVYSAGVGYRQPKFFLDMGYRRQSRTEIYSPYAADTFPLQEVENDENVNRLVFTAGVKF